MEVLYKKHLHETLWPKADRFLECLEKTIEQVFVPIHSRQWSDQIADCLVELAQSARVLLHAIVADKHWPQSVLHNSSLYAVQALLHGFKEATVIVGNCGARHVAPELQRRGRVALRGITIDECDQKLAPPPEILVQLWDIVLGRLVWYTRSPRSPMASVAAWVLSVALLMLLPVLGYLAAVEALKYMQSVEAEIRSAAVAMADHLARSELGQCVKHCAQTCLPKVRLTHCFVRTVNFLSLLPQRK